MEHKQDTAGFTHGIMGTSENIRVNH